MIYPYSAILPMQPEGFVTRNGVVLKREMQKVLEVVASVYSIQVIDIFNKSKKRMYSEPRYVVCYFVMSLISITQQELAKDIFDSDDHSLVSSAIKSVRNLCQTDPDFKNKIDYIYTLL